MLPLRHKCLVGDFDKSEGRWSKNASEDVKRVVEQDNHSAMT